MSAARAAPTTSARPNQRVGIIEGLRQSIGPPDVRADIAALPELARHTKSLWLPALAIVAATGLALAGNPFKDAVSALAFQVALVPPPFVMAFLSGMLTTRASYLTGGLTAVLAAIGFSLVILLTQAEVTHADGTIGPPNSAEQSAAVAQAIVLSPIGGVLGGAFAGFYRRFLSLTSAASARRPAQKPSRPAPRRR
ncbi:MAG TPA: hypothetical protein VIV06_12210 [Candidatus Limnocylindrales bacterium]